MKGLRADEARLAFGVVRAFLDRERDGLRALLISVVLFSTACFLYFLTELVVTAFFPVLLLAVPPMVARLAVAALLRAQVWEQGRRRRRSF